MIADRHPIVLQGLTSVFASHRDFEIVASCRDGASCVEAIRNLVPDVALLADSLPDVTASEILAIANAENLSTRLVFFTASVEHDLAAAIAAGACSAVSKYASPETLLKSLRLVAEGISLLPEPSPDLAPIGTEVSGANIEDVLAVLTDREREIMSLVSEGLSNKAIARRLNISQGTIKVHLHHIYQKLEINNRTVLAALAISQRYGGFGTLSLAALTFVAMDDVQAADPNASNGNFVASSPREDAMLTYGISGGTAGVYTYVPSNDAVNVLAAPTTETSTITVSDGTLSGSQAYKVTIGVANAAPGTPTAAGKLINTDVYSTATTFTAVSSPRPNSIGYGTFMMTAAGVLSYTFDNANSAVHALDVGDALTDTFTVTTAGGTKQAVTVPIRGSTDAGPNDFDNLSLGDREISGPPFVVGTPRGDTIAGGGEFQIDTVNGTGKDDPLYAGSGNDTINGESGIDTVNGNNGLDTIISGFGGDRLKGSNGNDTYVYLAAADSNSARFDTISDFASRSDRVNLAAFGALTFMALSPSATSVPPHTIAWISDSANNETIVYVNQTDQTLDIGDLALLEIHLQGVAFVAESDFVCEPATATVAATGEGIDPALAAMVAGDALKESSADVSVDATLSETARVTDSIWNTADESFSFHFARERVDPTGSAWFVSFGKTPEYATEDGGSDALTLASASSVELPRSHATVPVEDHFTFDQAPIHASSAAMTTGDAAVIAPSQTIDLGGFPVANTTAASQHAEHDVTPGGGVSPKHSQGNLHTASENRSAAAELQLAEQGAASGGAGGPDQSQRDLHTASENHSAAAEQHAEHDAQPGNSHGQSQRELQAASENGSAAAEQHAKHGATPGNGAGPDQSQRELQAASENGSAAAEQHAKHGATPGNGAGPDQSQRELQAASENGSAAAEQHAKHGATPGNGAGPDQSQRELQAASENGSAAAEQHAKHGAT
ncbi:LuxR C-terminal-related transcriptional regulator, partial [Bradyrhizobium valentinum]|uniref:LuxR C-terminal-related transcriptional regulator n=1 Tax=Bradyrhizobium valentinum TaxID=1518501 RepID=UPI001FD93CE7